MAEKELVAYELPTLDANLDVEVDFIDSDNLAAIEEGIRRVEGTAEVLALVQGIAVVKIEREELWRQDGFETLQAYRIAQNERLGLPRQTLSNRRKMAEAYLDNRAMLARVPLEGNLSKLPLLKDALAVTDNWREVLSHFRSDSYRDFRAWVYPALPEPDLPDVELKVRGRSVYLDGSEALSFSEDLPAERRALLVDQLKAAARAWAGQCIAHVVPCYDEGEARAVDNFLKKYRTKK